VWVCSRLLTVAPIVVTALLFHQVAFFEHAGLARTQVRSGRRCRPVPAYLGLAAVGSIRATTSGIRNAATAGALALVIQWGDLWSAQLALAALGVCALLCTALLPANRSVRAPVAAHAHAAPADGYSA
jgi:hypothetical protein